MTDKIPVQYYYAGQWHYPEGTTDTDVVRNALVWALDDLKSVVSVLGHPHTITPKALHDALEVLEERW